MIADHGMGKSAPNLSFHEQRSQQRRVNMWSNKLQQEMDEEVNSIVQVTLKISFCLKPLIPLTLSQFCVDCRATFTRPNMIYLM